jgi:hypothetical protein
LTTPQDEFMEDDRLEEANPTILEVELFPESPKKHKREDFERITDLLSDHEFSIADISIEQGGNPILTDAFISTSEHLDSVEEIQKTLSEWFPEHEVTYSRTYSDFYRETAVFPETQLLTVLHSE